MEYITAQSLERRGYACLQRQELGEAAAIARQLQEQHPTHTGTWAFAAEVAMQSRDIDRAFACSARAVELAPTNVFHAANQARYRLQAGRLRDALGMAQHTLSLAPRVPAILDMLGSIFSICADHQTALGLFTEAVRTEPNNAHFLLNLSMELRFVGNVQEAERCVDRSLELNPRDCEAHLHRSALRKQTPERCHIHVLERHLAAGVGNWRDEVQLRYALAKEYEDLGEYSLSFEHLQAGASLRRRNTRYQVTTDIAVMDEIRAAYSSEEMHRAVPGHDSPEPIFIVGLPRTGTTLIERILTSHTAVSSAGELQDFGALLTELVHRLAAGKKLDRLEFVRLSRNVDFAELGRRYIDNTRYITGRTAHFIDKLPGNFLYVGLIRRALPRAKIIHLRRNPMDAGYSIYKTLFKHAYPFSYDLTELGRYYVSYRQLMDHWRAVTPDAILDVDYEAMVADQVTQTQRLLRFCGLEWQDRVLDFHENEQPCTTASASQVREKIYSTSVGKWRCFERQLAPFRDVLDTAGLLPDRV